jgi:hypothetical protein
MMNNLPRNISLLNTQTIQPLTNKTPEQSHIRERRNPPAEIQQISNYWVWDVCRGVSFCGVLRKIFIARAAKKLEFVSMRMSIPHYIITRTMRTC